MLLKLLTEHLPNFLRSGRTVPPLRLRTEFRYDKGQRELMLIKDNQFYWALQGALAVDINDHHLSNYRLKLLERSCVPRAN